MTKQLFRRRASQSGITLLEVTLSLAIIAAATIGLNQLTERFSEDTENSVAASQLRTFGEAAKSYIKDNYAAVQAIATPTAPAIIDVPTLIAAGKLPAGYVNTNAFGQATCALVLEPTANRLQAMVITEGGTVQGDPTLGNVAVLVGGSGGGVYSTATGTIRGAVGGWSVPVADFDNKVNNLARRCDGAAGNVRVEAGHSVMALWFENGDTSSAFVARDAVPGRPELNAMNTPLVMNSVQTVNAACTTTGAIARDGTGGVVSCQGGTWKPMGGGKCEATTADLNNLQEDGRCYNGLNLPNSPGGGDWVFVEVYRHYDTSTYYLTQRVIGMTGPSIGKTWARSQNSATAGGGWTAWTQQADPQVGIGNGTGSVSAAGNVVAGGTVQGGYVYSTGNVAATGTVQGSYVYSSGTVAAAGDLLSNNNAVNYNGAHYNFSDSWAFLTYARNGAMYGEPQNARGSLHVNDIYIRAAGKWASQLGGSGPYNNELYGVNTGYAGCWSLPGYGVWAVWISSIQYWPASRTSGEGPTYASGVYGGGNWWCAGAWTQLIGYAWRIS